jgi:hypothetical protein
LENRSRRLNEEEWYKHFSNTIGFFWENMVIDRVDIDDAETFEDHVPSSLRFRNSDHDNFMNKREIAL